MKAIRSLARKHVMLSSSPPQEKEESVPDFTPGQTIRLRHDKGENWHRKLFAGELFTFLAIHPKHAPYATQYLEVEIQEGVLASARTKGVLPASYFEKV